MTVVLGGLAAILFGVGDLIAGIGGRREGSRDAPAQIAFTATCVGAVLSGCYLLFVDDSFSGNDLYWAFGAGAAMSAARPLLYRGMMVGPIVVFAPVFALVALIVPAVIGPLVGQGMDPLEVIGVAIALPAVVLVSSERRLPTYGELRHSPILGLACAVGGLIGLAGVFLSFVSEGAGAAPAVVITTTGVVVIPLVSAALGQRVIPGPITIRFGGAVGLTSVTAFILAAITYQRGSAAVGSALIGLSPGVSILLAWKLLGEKIWPVQVLGGVLGVTTVVLFALAI